jgi:L-asparaginase II
MSGPVVLARVLRSGVEESVHLGSVAVADAEGRVVVSAGDPGRPVFARSASKPFQAAVSIELGGLDLSDREVAVMAASHNGEAVHVDAVRSLLKRAGLGEGDLRCPPAWPLDPDEARGAPEQRRLLHDCSGKHAGMLLASLRAGLDLATYPDPSHPLQRRVTEAIAAASGREPLGIGIDGCGVPVHRLPLAALATAYARLDRSQVFGSLESAVRLVVTAMRAEPYQVAGRGRICTALMEATPVVAKVGAEGIGCAALPGRGLGVAVKIEDGAARAMRAALVRTLELLEVVDPGHPRVAEHARPRILGGGAEVGAVEASFSLR